MSSVTVAFYKGRGRRWRDRLIDFIIRTVTWSPYSHVEIILNEAKPGDRAFSFSSSARDGGVRSKWITFHEDQWDLVPVQLPVDYIMRRSSELAGVGGKKYDYLALIGLNSNDRWFCSELVGYLLGFPRYSRLSPGELHDVLTWSIPKWN